MILAAMILATASVIAQQDALFTHYMYNTLGVNPAYAGSRNALTVTALHRSQWVNFEGAPVTQSLNAHAPLMEDKLGVGFSLLNDKIGPIKNLVLQGDVAYRMKVNRKDKLVFGLKAGVTVLSGDLTSLTTRDAGDSEFMADVQSSWRPNFGMGIYYQSRLWYAGFSAPKILENRFSSEDDQSLTYIRETRDYYGIAGVLVDMGRRAIFKPTTLVRIAGSSPVSAELTGVFILDKKFSLGMMYRTENAVGALLGYYFSQKFSVGYSFDWSTGNKTGRYNAGSHELMLRYDVHPNGARHVVSPRFF